MANEDETKNRFLQKIKEMQEKQGPNVDWAARRDWWIGKVDALIADIQAWMKPYVDQGLMQIQPDRISIAEQYIGSYSISCAAITVGGATITIRPVATVVVGGFGRIDMESDRGRVLLVLSGSDGQQSLEDKMAGAHWYVVEPDKKTRYAPLTESAFIQLVSDLLGLSDER